MPFWVKSPWAKLPPGENTWAKLPRAKIPDPIETYIEFNQTSTLSHQTCNDRVPDTSISPPVKDRSTSSPSSLSSGDPSFIALSDPCSSDICSNSCSIHQQPSGHNFEAGHSRGGSDLTPLSLDSLSSSLPPVRPSNQRLSASQPDLVEDVLTQPPSSDQSNLSKSFHSLPALLRLHMPSPELHSSSNATTPTTITASVTANSSRIRAATVGSSLSSSRLLLTGTPTLVPTPLPPPEDNSHFDTSAGLPLTLVDNSFSARDPLRRTLSETKIANASHRDVDPTQLLLDHKRLTKRCSELEKVLDHRESKLVDLCHQLERLGRENVSLTERLEQSDSVKQSLPIPNKHLTGLEQELADKTDQIAQLFREGEQLSQDQLKANALIKKLRVAERRAKEELVDSNNKNEQLTGKLESIRVQLKQKEDSLGDSSRQFNQLLQTIQGQEVKMTELKTQLDKASSREASSKAAIDSLESKLADTSDQLSQARSQLETRSGALDRVNGLEKENDRLQKELHSTLASLASAKRLQAQRDEQWRLETSSLQDLLANANAQLELEKEASQSLLMNNAVGPTSSELTNHSSQRHSTMVGGSEIERLDKMWEQRFADFENQSHQSIKQLTADWSSKLVLTNRRLTESQSTLSLVETTKRQLERTNHELERQVTAGQARIDKLATESRQLKEQLQQLHHQLVKLEQQRLADLEDRTVNQQSINPAWQFVDNELNPHGDLRQSSNASVASLSFVVNADEPGRQPGTSNTDVVLQSPFYDRLSLMSSKSRSPSESTSLDLANIASSDLHSPLLGDRLSTPTIATNSSQTVLEHMQAALQLRQGECRHLKTELNRASTNNERLLGEMARLVDENRRLAKNSTPSSSSDLEQHHEQLLELYGKAREEIDELKLDLVEAKEAYKSQIELLLQNK